MWKEVPHTKGVESNIVKISGPIIYHLPSDCNLIGLFVIFSCAREECVRLECLAARTDETGRSGSKPIAQVHDGRTGGVRDPRGTKLRQPGPSVRRLDSMGLSERKAARARRWFNSYLTWYSIPYQLLLFVVEAIG